VPGESLGPYTPRLTSLLALGALLSFGESARADVNMCWELVEPIFVPPTPLDGPECIAANWPICFLMPHCCLPTCNLHPECSLGGRVLEGHWETVECSFMPPELALEKLLRGLARPADDAFEPVRAAATLQVEALRSSGSEIPEFVQTIVNELAASPELAASAGFRPGDALSARLQPERAPTAGLYLTRGFGAITLDRLIILRNATFDALLNEPPRSTRDVLCGNTSAAFRGALSTLMHELVHVRQWDVLGEDTFLTNYLIETLSQGYGSDAFETQAYNFGSAATALLPASAVCTAEPPVTPPLTSTPCFDACLDDCNSACPGGREFHACSMGCRSECRGQCARF
jgi:hypothetical protein